MKDAIENKPICENCGSLDNVEDVQFRIDMTVKRYSQRKASLCSRCRSATKGHWRYAREA